MRLFQTLGIQKTVLALTGAAVAIGIAVASLVVVQAARIGGLEEEKARLDDLLPRVRTIAKLVVDLETGQRGFVVTGDQKFLEPYTAAAHDLPRLIGETRAALAGDAVGLAQLAHVEALAGEWITAAGEPAIAARRRTPGPALDAALAQMLRAQADTHTMDRLRTALAELDQSQRLATAVLRRDMDVAIERLLVTIPVGTGLGCLVVLLAGAWVAQGLHHRVETVAEQGERMAEGEIEMPEGLGEPNEVGRLLRAFATLGLRLKAQTLEGAAAQRRAAFLAEATHRLGATLDVEPTLNQVAQLAVPTLADWCTVDLLEEDGAIRRVAVAHADASKGRIAAALVQHPPDAGSLHPAAVAMRTRQSQMGGVRPEAIPAVYGPSPERLALVREMAPRSYVAVPLVARGRTLGALGLVYADSGRCYEPADLALAEELARRAAVAIDNARLFAASQHAEVRAAFLAEATGRVATSLDLDVTLESIGTLAVPDLADGCVIDLLPVDGQPARTTVAHVDAARAERVRETRRRYPVDPQDSSTLAEAIATRQPQLKVEITGAVLEGLDRDAAHLELLRAGGARSCVTAPLEARGRVLGTLTLISTRPERRFGRADVALAEQIARKAALAVDNALLYREAIVARSEARRQVEFTSAITSSLGEGVFALDPQGRITVLNQAAAEVLGWRESDLIGQRAEASFHPAHTTNGAPCVLLEGLEAGRTTRHEDDVFVGRTGQAVPVSMTASPILAQGRPAGAVIVFRDVSLRKALESRLREAHKMEAVGQLAGGIAHDFNNILTAILGYSELLGKRAGADDRLARGIEEIRKAAERAAGLTRQLLAFGRKQRLAPAVVDLEATLARLAPTLARVVGERVEVGVRHAPGAGRVKVDPNLLDEALTRLAMNARDAMPDGGRFTIETDDADLDGAYASRHVDVAPGAYVRITVGDTGLGMDTTTAAHAFEPFYTTKEVGRGSGLGLAMVHGFVRQSGGHIELTSAPGKGTTIRIFLPRADEPARTPGQPRQAGAAAMPRATVLLVDDEDALRSIARLVLEEGGYRVLEASDGEQALEAAAAHAGEISLLLTDVVMPGMNGREIAERLAEARPGIGVLYMSGYSKDVLDDSGGLGPGSAFLEKPFKPDALLRKVAVTLEAAARI